MGCVARARWCDSARVDVQHVLPLKDTYTGIDISILSFDIFGVFDSDHFDSDHNEAYIS